MIIMKRLFKTLLLAAVLIGILAVGAFAADYENEAQELSDMGLFLGTGSGFDLDRVPRRDESAVMLVRLLGAESEAKAEYEAGTITNPFSDVADWAAPYVAWLYSNGLTTGLPDGTYGSAMTCDAQQYCTFTLRALGYSDGTDGDFTYADALTFAQEKGLYNSTVFSGTFLRDDVVAVSYQALATQKKDSSETLLETLVDDGVVSQANAQTILDKINTYKAYVEDTAAWNDTTGMDMSMDMTAQVEIPDYDVSYNMNIHSDIKATMQDDNIGMEAITTTDDGQGGTMTVSEWIQDGWLYMETEDEKVKMDLGLDDLLSTLKQETSYADLSLEGLYLVDDITSVENADGSTTYTITYGDVLSSMAQDLAQVTGEESGMDMSISNMVCVVTLDQDGMPTGIHLTFDLQMVIAAGDQSVSANCSFAADCTINEMGDDVTITYPDFSEFAEASTASVD